MVGEPPSVLVFGSVTQENTVVLAFITTGEERPIDLVHEENRNTFWKLTGALSFPAYDSSLEL